LAFAGASTVKAREAHGKCSVTAAVADTDRHVYTYDEMQAVTQTHTTLPAVCVYIQFSFIYIAPNYNKCNFKALK